MTSAASVFVGLCASLFSASQLFCQTLTFNRTDISTGTGPRAVAVADFNRDGIVDIAVLNSGSSSMSILLGNGDGTFKSALDTGLNGGTALAVGDFNLDGIPDVIANDGSVLLGKGDGTFQAPIILQFSFDGIAVGDFNGDGKPDLAMTSFGDGMVYVALGNGDGTFQTPSSNTVGKGEGSGTVQVAVSDLNLDGKLDIVAVNEDSNNISVLLGNGNGTFASAVNYSTAGIVPVCLVIGDVNGDGKPDVVIGDQPGVEVFLGNGDGTFQNPSSISLPPYVQSVAIGDINGDSKPDVVAAREQGSASTSFALVLPGNGNGTFGTPAAFAVGEIPLSLALAYFSGKSKLDIVTANQSGDGVSVLLNGGTSGATVAATSVTPRSGSSASQAFTFEYSDLNGAADLSQVWVWFDSSTSRANSSNSCLLYYDLLSNSVFLQTDNGAGWTGDSLGNTGSSPLFNSQCSFNTDDVTVSVIGTSLTLNLPTSFSASFGGSKTVYMMAVDKGGATSGWVSRGTWTVPSNVSVTSDSVSPNYGSGGDHQFVLEYSDSAGTANLQSVWVLFNTTFANPAAHSCMLNYQPATNQVALLNDAGTAWTQGQVGAGPTSLQNSQCSVSLGGTWVNQGGSTLTLSLAMTFEPSFSGLQNIYMYANDLSGINSGWQQMGTWTTPSSITVSTISSIPASGIGTSQNFALQYADSVGNLNLQSMWLLFNATFANSPANSCMIYYQRSTNQLNLLNDAGTGWTSALLENGMTLQNSQCSIDMTYFSLTSFDTNNVIVNLPVTFKPSFAGMKNVYMYAADLSGANSGWTQQGTWTVPSSFGAFALGLTPGSGSGTSETFALEYSDTAPTIFQSLYAYFNTTLANPATNACQLYYSYSSNQINLLGDNGTTWEGAVPGTAATLQNSQCSLNVAATTVALSGSNTMTLNLALTFQPAYAGQKNIYLYANDALGSNSGWQLLGTFNVTSNCTYGLGATNVTVGSAASNGMVAVSTMTGCGWTASSNVAWLAISSGSSGSGNGTVGYSVAANTATSQRAGTLTVAGKTFTVTQSGMVTSSGPTAASVSPPSGSGQSQTFAAVYNDTSGASAIATAYVLIASDTSGVNGCWIQFSAGSSTYNIMNDGGTTWSAPVSVGSGTVSNSQCTFYGPGAGATTSGNNLTVNFPVTFAASYAGAQNVYLKVVDVYGQSSDWQQVGSFTVTGEDSGATSADPVPTCNAQGYPCVVSLSPLTGSGVTGTFTGVFNHAGGASQHYLGYILFLPTPNIVDYTATGSCLVEYNRIDNAMRLVNNAGTNWLPGVVGIPLTKGGTLTNDFCTLDITKSSAVVNGTTMTVTVAMTFNSSFSGELATFMQGFDVTGAFTGMTQFGNWEVDAGAQKPGPYVVGMTPTSGAGSSATLTFTTGDTKGIGDLDFVTMLIAPVIDGALPCQAFYFPYSNIINLVNDSSTAMVSTNGIAPGTAGTLSNSRCSINTGAASSSSTPDTVTVTLPMTFNTSTFGGAKNIYLNAFDDFGNLSHWVTAGTWTVQ